ncbi:hypothetical protein D3C86_1316090 [compost metagenome]
MSSYHLRIKELRSAADVLRHNIQAASAAVIAFLHAAISRSATESMTFPVEGLMTSNVFLWEMNFPFIYA